MSGAARTHFQATFRALANHNFRLFYIGRLISESGSWMQRVAQAWLVLELTGSALALGTVMALQTLPLLLFSLFGGVIADRWPKRRLLYLTQVVQGLQAFALATLAYSGQTQLWHIYVLSVLLGLAYAIDTPARQAMISEMVGTDDLPNAVALNSSLMNVTRIVGPAIAGSIIAWVGVTACFIINGLTYIAVIGALKAMRSQQFLHQVRAARAPILTQIREGLSFAVRTRQVCLTLILGFAIGCFGFNNNVVLPLIAHFVLDVGPLELGVMFTFLGLGSVMASLTLASRRRPSEKIMFASGTILALALFGVGTSPWYLATLVFLFVQGAAGGAFIATSSTTMQLAPPPQLRGRVMSIFTLLFFGTTPIGGMTIGVISEHFGVSVAVAFCASVAMLGMFVGWIYAHRNPGSLAVGGVDETASTNPLPTRTNASA